MIQQNNNNNKNGIDNGESMWKALNVRKDLYELMATLTNNTETHKINYKTAIFYANDMFGCGKRYIISQSFGNHNQMNTISPSEIRFQMCMSSFASKLTRSMSIEFGELLSLMKHLYIDNVVKPVCPLASNYADLRRIYIDGLDAISKNVPTPIASMKEQHSYVSLIDCVSDFMIRKDNLLFNIDDWDNIINDSKLAKDMHIFCCEKTTDIVNNAKSRINIAMLERTLPTIPLFITFWSDDFDPNKSVKNNRQSVWIKTVTIFTMGKNGEKIQGTYVLSLSLKKLDHNVVETLFLNDLEKLRKGKLLMMYSRSNRSLVYIHADIFCVMNDQPERRFNLDLSNGNSSLHGCFGLLLDCKKVKDYIRSCDQCQKSILLEATTNKFQKKWRSKKCKKCTAWLYNIESKLLHYEPDQQYPLSMMEQKLFKPTIITKSHIENGVKKMLIEFRQKKLV